MVDLLLTLGYAGGGGGAGGAGIGPPSGAGGDGSPVVPLFGSHPQPYYPSSTFQSTYAGGGVGGGNGVNNPFGFRPPGGGGHGAPTKVVEKAELAKLRMAAGAGETGTLEEPRRLGGSGSVLIKEPSGGLHVLEFGVYKLNFIGKKKTSGLKIYFSVLSFL